MAICSFFMQGRCKFGDKCWNEHPRDGRHQGHNRYQSHASAASSNWNSSGQRYVQPSNFSKNLTWTNKDNDRRSYESGSTDNRNRSSKSNAPSGFFSAQNRFGALANQEHARDSGQDKEGSPLSDIVQDLETWESSGQWLLSVYCYLKDQRHLSGFSDISPEELRLEFYTSHKEGHLQNYVNSVQQLVNQWKQRVHEIKNWNQSISALLNQLTKPSTATAPTGFGGTQPSGSFGGAQPSGSFGTVQPSGSFGGTQQPASFGGTQPSGFGSSGTSANKTVTAATFSFKLDSNSAAPNSGASTGFPTAPAAPAFNNKPSFGFNNTGATSAASFSFAPATTSDGAASTFSGFGSASSSIGASGFGSSASTGFGKAAVTGGFGSNVGASSTFGGTTSTSGFGAGPTGDSNLSTPGTLFGQVVTVSGVSQAVTTSSADFMSSGALFTPRNELSQEDLVQFEAKMFTIGRVPLLPPPVDLLTLK
ncbi:nucleoporin NUP42 [Leptodactylus fuscus]|uniref:nucleoporin NUP42 n=1 Tax=Leptodactylus fuscus TaxID=238119 RepID=UPI003F4F2101